MTDGPGPDRDGANATLEALREAVPPARDLGLDVAPAERLLAEATERLGLGADVYVVALVGGTGVGKSSLLNALAGSNVSASGARRPTTASPIAWIPETAGGEIGQLLDRLGAGTRRVHHAPGLERVVVLDLPDIDSLEVGHRAAVEAALPRVDVVAWVTDPEKYADAVLHDGFLRHWLPRLDRQIVVLNKMDRLPPDRRDGVARDLASVVARELPIEARRVPPPVILTAAVDGVPGVEALGAWLREAADAKAIVAARLAAAGRAELADLAHAAGVDAGYRPLLSSDDRSAALDQAVRAALRAIDLRGAEDRAVSATRSLARRRGTGPAGFLTSAVLRLLGRTGRASGPAEHLQSWRRRGDMTAAAEPVRAAVLTGLAALPPGLRGRYALAGAEDLERRMAVAVDQAIARQDATAAPSSRWWPVFGLLQSANQVAIALVAAWLVVWFIVRPQLPDIVLPVVGPVPAPLVLLGAALLVGYVLARLLSLHAGWLGRRWARRLGDGLRRDVAAGLAETAFAGVDQLEAARAEIAGARERAEAARRAGEGVRTGRLRRIIDAAVR